MRALSSERAECVTKREKENIIQRKRKMENWFRLLSGMRFGEYLLEALKDVFMLAFFTVSTQQSG